MDEITALSRLDDRLPDVSHSGSKKPSAGSFVDASSPVDVIANDSGFTSILSNLKRASSDATGNDVTSGHVTGAFADGECAEEQVSNPEPEAELEQDADHVPSDHMPSDHVEVHVVEVCQTNDVTERGSSPVCSEIYAKVIKPARLVMSSVDDEEQDDGGSGCRSDEGLRDHDITENTDTGWVDGPAMVPVVSDRWLDNPEEAPDQCIRPKAGEWQEMVLEVGDDFDLDETEQYQLECEFPNNRLPSSNYPNNRAVTFTRDTKDNEGYPGRYPTEGINTEGEWFGNELNEDVTNTWPHKSKDDPEHDISIVLHPRHYETMPTGLGHGRLFPGTTTVLPPGAPVVVPPYGSDIQPVTNSALLERGIRITDTDTWRRNPDNTSVIKVDCYGENRSVASHGQTGGGSYFASQIGGGSYIGSQLGEESYIGNHTARAWSMDTSHGSLNKSGSANHPTMLVTSAVYAHSKHGLLVNGTNMNGLAAHDLDDAKMATNIKYEKNEAIEKEKKQKKCRVIVFSVIMLIVVAVFIGVLVKFT
ncbi:hypothetical protein LSH36_19g08005 [Paralvinella palmiformis]|uniref:Uncharacterized protein n=1 Tax=Paralvinella palmiformis TaxID=53620 RepID=A0AAD9NIC6_9ANNE|nr:hypothetical protein LSH36_19g08005 [Paralvinella palmiformis]